MCEETRIRLVRNGQRYAISGGKERIFRSSDIVLLANDLLGRLDTATNDPNGGPTFSISRRAKKEMGYDAAYLLERIAEVYTRSLNR